MQQDKNVDLFLNEVNTAISTSNDVVVSMINGGCQVYFTCVFNDIYVDDSGAIEIDSTDGTEIKLESWDNVDADNVFFCFKNGTTECHFDFSAA